MADLIGLIFNTDYLFTVLRVMTPFCSLPWPVSCSTGGVDAIGTEGMMLLSALAGVIGGHYTGHLPAAWWWGLRRVLWHVLCPDDQ